MLCPSPHPAMMNRETLKAWLGSPWLWALALSLCFCVGAFLGIGSTTFGIVPKPMPIPIFRNGENWGKLTIEPLSSASDNKPFFRPLPTLRNDFALLNGRTRATE